MEYAQTKVSWKVSAAGSLLGGLFLEVYFSGWEAFASAAFLLNFSLKVVWLFLLWQGARLIFRITEKRFRWHNQDAARILVSGILAALFSFAAVFAFSTVAVFLTGAYQPLISDIPTDALISTLVLLLILGGINIRTLLISDNERSSEIGKSNEPEYFKAIVDELEDVIQVVDGNGKVLFTNSAIFHLLGFTPEEAYAADAFQFLHPDDKERIGDQFRELTSKGPARDYEVEYRLITRDGNVRHVATRVVNALSNPEVKGFIAMVRDITRRKEDEKALKQSLSVNRAIIESTAEGILVTDLSDNIIQYNEAFKEMWLLTDDMLRAGKKSEILEHAIKNVENADEVYEIISGSDEKISERIALIAYLKNGKVLEGISMPQRIDGKVVGRIWSNRDITDRINSEKEEIEKGVAQAQFESLKNQVNPHFLFNSLNVLSSLVHIDPDLSEKFIDQLAKSYRYLLEQKDNELVPLKTEIDFVTSFTFLLKIRFEEKLQIKINLSAKALNYCIAPLTLQLLIENAVKHNIVSSEAPLLIEIGTDEEGYLVVSNNLQLRANEMPSTHVGLKNITSRYKLLTERAPDFRVTGQKYIARIPLIKSDKKC